MAKKQYHCVIKKKNFAQAKSNALAKPKDKAIANVVTKKKPFPVLVFIYMSWIHFTFSSESVSSLK